MIQGIAENGWHDIMGNERHAAHTKKLLNSTQRWNPESARMLKYLSEFFLLSCAPDMLAMRIFPNAKEITESFAAYNAARYKMQMDLKDSSISVVCVGDGSTPRTAATFAMRSAWTCYSVDPLSKGGIKRWEPIKRLTVVRDKIENFSLTCERALIVAVHSHAPLEAAVRSVKAERVDVIAMPCCVSQNVPGRIDPLMEYDDRHVMSPCRKIKIWNNVR